MATVTLTLRGDQLGTYDSLSANGNNAGRKVNLEGVKALGTSSDTYTVVVEQVNNGVTEFQNGQFVTIYDSNGNVVMPRVGINPDAEQGRAAGDEHLIIIQSNFLIDLGGVPVGPTSVRYDKFDEASDPDSGDNDGELDFNAFPCFGVGTLIATDAGDVPVEQLSPGMMVKTAGDKFVQVMWVGQREVTLTPDSNKQRPILCRAGSLGKEMPRRDLILSPQHRFCLGGAVVQAVFGDQQVLAPAKGLTELSGFRWMKGKKSIIYVSVLLDVHSVMFAEGVPVESLYPGEEALKTLGAELQEQLYALIPNLREQGVAAYGPPAMQLLTVQAAKRLAAQISQLQKETNEKPKKRKSFAA